MCGMLVWQLYIYIIKINACLLLNASVIPFHLIVPEEYRKDNVKDKLCIHSICIFVSHTPTHKHKYMYEKGSTIHGFYKKRILKTWKTANMMEHNSIENDRTKFLYIVWLHI